YTYIKAPEYESKSVLYVNSQQTSPQLGELLGLQGANRNIANEVEILKSRTIAHSVAQQITDMRTVPGTDEMFTILEHDDDGEPFGIEDVVRRLRQDYVSVRPLGRDVDLLEVVVTSTIPEEAQEIADLYAETYQDYNRTSSRARMTASREFLDGATQRFSAQLKDAEQDLLTFLNQESIVEPDEEARQLLQQFTDLQQTQYQTQLQLGMAQTELKSLETQMEKIVPGLAGQISSGNDLVIDRLKNAIATLQVEQQQIFARNPELRDRSPRTGRLAEIDQEIAQLSAQLEKRVDQLVQDATTSVTVLAPGTDAMVNGGAAGRVSQLELLRGRITESNIKVSGLQASLDIINQGLAELKARLREIPSKAILLKRLERTEQTQEQIYLTLLQKMQEARVAEQSELGYIEVIDKAFKPEEPVRPRPALNLLLGAVFGLMVGVGLAFLRNGLDTRIHRPEDLRKHGFTLLGVVPDMRHTVKSDFGGESHVVVEGTRYDTRLISLLNPLSPVAESYRRLRTNIQFSRPDVQVQTILITSAGPGEGKSVTATNLAVTMAQSGRRTVYVDADLRRPTGHTVLGVAREPGLVDLLFEAIPEDFEQFATAVDDLYVIPAGASVPNPAETLGSRRMRDLIARLRQSFDVIVIDSPPVLAVTDALLLSSVCDAVVLVCTSDETQWQTLERSAESFRDVGGRLTGIVLNRFNARSAGSGYGYGYGYGYYEYYGESAPVKQEA
ncbi:MAG TPA: polysaccharide biosynthesis tyrosine autokinase, partial [Rhodothermales bacterium]|nr:polysaccharide biosynthesis tyrosine autokinase [Rhodothermales bacterium]